MTLKLELKGSSFRDFSLPSLLLPREVFRCIFLQEFSHQSWSKRKRHRNLRSPESLARQLLAPSSLRTGCISPREWGLAGNVLFLQRSNRGMRVGAVAQIPPCRARCCSHHAQPLPALCSCAAPGTAREPQECAQGPRVSWEKAPQGQHCCPRPHKLSHRLQPYFHQELFTK